MSTRQVKAMPRCPIRGKRIYTSFDYANKVRMKMLREEEEDINVYFSDTPTAKACGVLVSHAAASAATSTKAVPPPFFRMFRAALWSRWSSAPQ